MRILMGARSCGFGPVSKLVAVSRLLPGHQRSFVGDTIADAFARNNADAFDEFFDAAKATSAQLDELVTKHDYVVSVMDADLVLRGVVAGRPTVMVDSLLSFWQNRYPLAEIRELCRTLPRDSYAAADRHLSSLWRHERNLAAHLLSTHSIIQNFPGVPQRVEALRAQGATSLHLSGSIVDIVGLDQPKGSAEADCDLLINIGGFQNFCLDFDTNNAYLKLTDRWVRELLRDWPQFERVVVCGGAYGAGREYDMSVSGRTATFRSLPQREFLRMASNARSYMLTPGLTAIHEAAVLGRLPMALPEQHYGHVFNLRGFEGTLFADLAARFADAIQSYRVPADDVEGTATIAGVAARMLEDDRLYRRFSSALGERIAAFVSLTDARRADGIAELRELLGGRSIRSVVSDILAATVERGR